MYYAKTVLYALFNLGKRAENEIVRMSRTGYVLTHTNI